jgi:hypothetical protein
MSLRVKLWIGFAAFAVYILVVALFLRWRNEARATEEHQRELEASEAAKAQEARNAEWEKRKAVGQVAPPRTVATPGSPQSAGDVLTVSKRVPVYDTEETIEAITKASRSGDKELFQNIMIEHGGHINGGTKVRILGSGVHAHRRVEVVGKSEEPIAIDISNLGRTTWWISRDFLQ